MNGTLCHNSETSWASQRWKNSCWDPGYIKRTRTKSKILREMLRCYQERRSKGFIVSEVDRGRVHLRWRRCRRKWALYPRTHPPVHLLRNGKEYSETYPKKLKKSILPPICRQWPSPSKVLKNWWVRGWVLLYPPRIRLLILVTDFNAECFARL